MATKKKVSADGLNNSQKVRKGRFPFHCYARKSNSKVILTNKKLSKVSSYNDST